MSLRQLSVYGSIRLTFFRVGKGSCFMMPYDWRGSDGDVIMFSF